ncbi:hypothetical protein GCM10009069_10380 [Algimonas arctica]|uniref:Uncharacterized protein n=1 Tax=Algimonas arctica TaxID=1479486 RepID=A0A8J3CR89_9PROT|nr:hypothetical protein [Algimonas arctica]GHA89238.1 hypothetical protein GCM10009069_10380 [Algimonas arctica]
MKKIDRSLTNIKFKLGYLRLSASQLIILFEKIGIEHEVSAENNDYEFENFQDMKANKELLVGRPKIQLRLPNPTDIHSSTIYIDLSGNCELRAYSLESHTQLAELEKLKERLSAFKTPFSFIGLLGWRDVILLLTSIAFFVWAVLTANRNNPANIVLITSYSVAILASFLFWASFFLNNFFRPITNKNIVGTWDRIKDNIYSHVVISTITAIVVLIAAWLGFKP